MTADTPTGATAATMPEPRAGGRRRHQRRRALRAPDKGYPLLGPAPGRYVSEP